MTSTPADRLNKIHAKALRENRDDFIPKDRRPGLGGLTKAQKRELKEQSNDTR